MLGTLSWPVATHLDNCLPDMHCTLSTVLNLVLFDHFFCSAESQTEESSCDGGSESNVTLQPRQQAPPADDSDMLFPSPPPELSCHIAAATVIQWPTESPASVPFVTNTETVQPTCSIEQNFVNPVVAVVQSSESDNMVTETNLDEITHINDAENMNSVLALIRKGVKLRKTVTNDRSAPKLD